MEQFFDNLTNELYSLGIRLLYAVLILVVGIVLTKLVCRLLKKSRPFTKLEKSAQTFLLSVLRMTLYILVAVSAAIALGVPTATFVAVLGAGGVAIGLALQGSLSNLAGGLMLVVFKPFRVGDYIESQTCAGFVKSITIFYTTLTTADNLQVTLPNGSLSNAVVTNSYINGTRRLELDFSIAYSADIESVRRVMLDAAGSQSIVLKEPEPVVVLTRFADSALNLQLRCYVRAQDYLDAVLQLNEAIKKRFDENGIEIPFPQLEVHLNKK